MRGELQQNLQRSFGRPRVLLLAAAAFGSTCRRDVALHLSVIPLFVVIGHPHELILGFLAEMLPLFGAVLGEGAKVRRPPLFLVELSLVLDKESVGARAPLGLVGVGVLGGHDSAPLLPKSKSLEATRKLGRGKEAPTNSNLCSNRLTKLPFGDL